MLSTMSSDLSAKGRDALKSVIDQLRSIGGVDGIVEKFAREIALKDDGQASAEIQKASNAIAAQLTGPAFSARLAKAMGLAFGDLIAMRYNEITTLEGRA